MKPHLPRDARADLWIEPVELRETSVELACRIDFTNCASHRIWFRFPLASRHRLTQRADPFIVAVLLHTMTRARHLRVRGTASGGLLQNLDDFQHAYCAYHPSTHQPVRIEADRVVDDPPEARDPRAMTAFSGGVDGTFSLYRHTARSELEPKRPLRAALLMHGMDVPVGEPGIFAQVARRCAAVAEDAGVELRTGVTNVRFLPVPWEDAFGAAVAACLLFFQDEYSLGLIPSSYAYDRLHPDHGSNPLTDPLLSSALMAIVHDGASFGRIEKLRQLSSWPLGLEQLRVCWQPGEAGNCGRCEKCVRTQLMLELCGVDRCGAFPRRASLRDLDNLVVRTSGGLHELAYLAAEARRSGARFPWIVPIERAVARNARYLRFQAAIREAGGMIPTKLRRSAAGLARRLFAQNPPPPPPAITVPKAS